MTTPAPPVNPGTALAGAGRPITLAGGRTVNLRYGFKSLLHLEERFGGIGAVSTMVGTDLSKPVFGPMLDLLAAGLLGEHDGNGAPLTRERLADLLDPAELQTYMTVAGEAMNEAFPTPAPAAGQPVTGPALPASPGTTGTTSPPSSSDATIAPSGS